MIPDATAATRNKGNNFGWNEGAEKISEKKTGAMSSSSTGHAHREKHVCYRQPLLVALAKKKPSGARMEWENSSPSHFIWH